MKKIIPFFLISLLLLSACASKGSYNSAYMLGVIETTGLKNKSAISYYDKNLSKVNTMSLPYGSMEYYGFTEPIIHDGHLYMYPLGLYTKKDLGILLDMDLESGKTEKVKFNRINITSAVITDEAFYVVSNLNQVSYIDRYDRETSEITTISVMDQLVMHIKEHEGKIVGVGLMNKEVDAEVTLLEFDFQNNSYVELLDLSPWCEGKDSPIHFSSYEGKLYISLGQKLLIYSKESRGLEEIELPNSFAEQILIHKDTFYILHADIIGASVNSTVTILNPKNMEMASCALKRKVWQIEMKDNLLYALDLENRVVAQYQMENGSFEEVLQIPIETANGMTASAMFLK
ncbi:MAG: hypothetical protein WBI17_04900 [Clostridiaceae bacterium]